MSVAASVLSRLDATRAWQEDFYRDLHAHPELSHQEHETARKVAERLEQFSFETSTTVLDAIRRIVTAECDASGSPKPPEFELFARFPVTDNDAATTEKVASAFAEFFGVRSGSLPQQSASEDFSDIPTALGAPYTYWGIGCTDPDAFRTAADAGRVAQDIPGNHSPYFAPVLQPTLDTGTQALVVAALAWLAS